MRTTRMELVNGRDRIPLVVRARFEKTFFGLGAFAGVVLLLGGGYLMIEALIDPLGASDVAVLTAGFALALSSFLLVYLVWPNRRMELAKHEHAAREEAKAEPPVLTVYGKTLQHRIVAKRSLGDGKNLPGPM